MSKASSEAAGARRQRPPPWTYVVCSLAACGGRRGLEVAFRAFSEFDASEHLAHLRHSRTHTLESGPRPPPPSETMRPDDRRVAAGEETGRRSQVMGLVELSHVRSKATMRRQQGEYPRSKSDRGMASSSALDSAVLDSVPSTTVLGANPQGQPS